jgi:hypothetical protein
MAEFTGSDLLSRAVLLQVSTGRFSVRRKVSNLNPIKVDADADGNGTDKGRLYIAAELLESKELDAVYSFDGATRRFLMTRALPVSLVAPGVYVMPLAVVDELDAYLTARSPQRDRLVDDFLAVYEPAARQGRLALGALADPAAYPPAEIVRRAFSLSWGWFTLGAPGQLEGIRADIFKRERERMAAEFSAALDEARQALRVMCAGMVDHLLDRLSPGADGRRKRFESSTVEKLVEWCDTFNARNLADDDALAGEVDKIRRALAGVSAEDLRGSAFTRREVTGALVGVRAALDGLLSDAPVRAFFADDVVPAAEPAAVA